MSQDVKSDGKKSIDCKTLDTLLTDNLLAPCWVTEDEAGFKGYFGPAIMAPKVRIPMAAHWIRNLKCQVGGLQEVDASTYPMLAKELSPQYTLGPMASSPNTSAKDADGKTVLNGTVLLYDATKFTGVSVVHSSRIVDGNGVAYMRAPVKLGNGSVVDFDFVSWHPDPVCPFGYRGEIVKDVIAKRRAAWLTQYAEVIKGCSRYTVLFTDANMEKYDMMSVANQTVFKKFLLGDREKFRSGTHASLREEEMSIDYTLLSDDLVDLLSSASDGGPTLPVSESRDAIETTFKTLMKFGSDHKPCTLRLEWATLTTAAGSTSPMIKS